jgi:hypothetical protein
VAPLPSPSPLSWASVAETAGTRNFQLPTQPAMEQTSSQHSWRSGPKPVPAHLNDAGATSRRNVPERSTQFETLSWRLPAERPKLNLVRSSVLPSLSDASFSTRSEGIFGKARPVDISDLSQENLYSNEALEQQLMCSYPPRILKAAKNFGTLWVANVEKKFKEVVDAGTSRKVLRLDPMPEPRRKLVQELATRYWGLHAIEIDPEPHRFLEISATPASFAPDMTLHRALITFPELSKTEFSGLGSSNGILFIGCPLSVTGGRLHELMRELQARESEYDIVMLDGTKADERNVYVEISSSERARKIFKRLQSNLPNAFRCRKIEWWPSGCEWAKHQIRMINQQKETLLAPARAQKKLEERKAKDDRLSKNTKTGWDDEEDEHLEALRAKLASTEWDEDEDSDVDDQKKNGGEMAEGSTSHDESSSDEG